MLKCQGQAGNDGEQGNDEIGDGIPEQDIDAEDEEKQRDKEMSYGEGVLNFGLQDGVMDPERQLRLGRDAKKRAEQGLALKRGRRPTSPC